MKIFLFGVFISLLFSACTSSSLVVSPGNELVLGYEAKKIHIAKGIVEKKSQWFKNIDIEQYKFQGTQGTLFYEHLYTDINWEFKYGAITTLKYIFDGTKANILYKDSAISCMQLQISKTQHINILTESSSFDMMSYVYGFSDKEFLQLVSSMQKDETVVVLNQHTKAVKLENSLKHLSKWSVRMLLLQPLLKPVARRGTGF